jgi:hypothetical protein
VFGEVGSFADSHHLDPRPDPDPDPTSHFDADPDSSFQIQWAGKVYAARKVYAATLL